MLRITALSVLKFAQVLKFTALSADLKSEEPIDVVCHESYPDNATVWDGYTLVKFVPFNPVDKYTMAIIKDNATDKIFRVMKGAPQVCPRSCGLCARPLGPFMYIGSWWWLGGRDQVCPCSRGQRARALGPVMYVGSWWWLGGRHQEFVCPLRVL